MNPNHGLISHREIMMVQKVNCFLQNSLPIWISNRNKIIFVLMIILISSPIPATMTNENLDRNNKHVFNDTNEYNLDLIANSDVYTKQEPNDVKNQRDYIIQNLINEKYLQSSNELSSSGDGKLYVNISTYIGGKGNEYVKKAILDEVGNIYLIGQTSSHDFPTYHAFDNSHEEGVNEDGFLMKLNPSGQIIFSTFIGGSDWETIDYLELDSNKNIIVAGGTSSHDFPTYQGFDKTYGENSDGFVMKFDQEGALIFSSFLGGNDWDTINQLELDSNNNIIMIGETRSNNFPRKNSFQTIYGGESDAFVMKLNASGQILFSSYLGGFNSESANYLLLEPNDNIIVAGRTNSMNFPTQNGFDSTIGGSEDDFVTLITATGQLVFSSFVGGSEWEYFNNQPVIDSNGNVILIGQTSSANFPTLNAFDSSFGGANDHFIMKVNATGQLVFSSFVGGNGWENINQLEIDSNNNIFLAGWTNSDDFPTLNGFSKTFGGNQDGFVMKINATGQLIFSSYIGLDGWEDINQLVLDFNDDFILIGQTDSTNFPTLNAFDSSFGGVTDDFIMKFNSTGQLIFSSFVGGTEWESVHEVVIDSNNNIIFTGKTNSNNFPIQNGFDYNFRGKIENYCFLIKLNSSGQLQVSTYIGGSRNDDFSHLEIDNKDNIIILGTTSSFDFLLFNAFDQDYDDSNEIFLMKLIPFFDTDNDLMDDFWENNFNLDNSTDDSLDDFDLDGMTNLYEFRNGLQPNKDDSKSDKDADGLSNILEYTISSAASRKDTDFDMMPDGFEYQYNLSVNTYDAYDDKDADGLPNLIEYFYGSNPDDFASQDIWPSHSIYFSTYIGGSSDDWIFDSEVDSQDNLIIVGTTRSRNFPTSNSFDPYFAGEEDIFVTKINPSGQLVFSNFLGGSYWENINDFVIDSHDNIIISGQTSSSNFPLSNAFDNNYGGNGDCFITKIDSSGRLVFSSFLGGSEWENIVFLDTDFNDNIIMVGQTNSADFTSSKGFKNNYRGGTDVFITKISSLGLLTFSRLLGGSNWDTINRAAIDFNNNIILIGQTNSADFPISNGFENVFYESTDDSFITKLDSTGQIIFSQFFGGSDWEDFRQIEVDSNNNIILAGTSNSADFLTTQGFEDSYNENGNGFVTKIDSMGNIVFSRLLGGSDWDSINYLAITYQNDIILAGWTNSFNFPTLKAFDTSLGGGGDSFITKIDATGQIVFSSYVGGSDQDSISHLDVDSQGNIIIAGSTYSTDFPKYKGLDINHSGNNDGFIMKISASGYIDFSTIVGGSDQDLIQHLGLDVNDNIYLAGITYSIDFPTLNGLDNNFEGSSNIFIMKIQSFGKLIFSTLIGGLGDESFQNVKSDSKGNILLQCNSNSFFMPTYKAFNPSYVGSSDLFLIKFKPFIDVENDNMDDSWELLYGLDITIDDSLTDSDNDGMTNIYEFQHGLNPSLNDALDDKDHDGMPNLWEYQMHLNPTVNDAFGDKDHDGMPNLWEYQMGLNAFDNRDADFDLDGDGLTNLEEYNLHTSAKLFDTDGDGIDDGYEVKHGMNPLVDDSHIDSDGDGVSNLDEYRAGTDPFNILSFPLTSFSYFLIIFVFIIPSIFLVFIFIKYFLVKIFFFKKKIGVPGFYSAFQVWKGHFKDYDHYKKAKFRGASTTKEYSLVLQTKAPDYLTAIEIQKGGFKDFDEYLKASVLGANTIDQYHYTLKYNAPDYKSALLTERAHFPSYDDYWQAKHTKKHA